LTEGQVSDVILVMLGAADAARGLLHAAAAFRRLLNGARINVLALKEMRQISALEAQVLVAETDRLVARKSCENDRVAVLETIYAQWLAEVGAIGDDTRWIEAEGDLAAVVRQRGSRADMIIAEQPSEGDKRTRQLFRAALFGTDRPVLMVRAGWQGTLGRCVAIAWRDDKSAARALIPALRFLAAAGRVHVLIGTRHGARPEMPKVLIEHGIRAELHALAIGSGPFGQTLLDKAHEIGADLLVMGAYAHSPLLDFILGGVTQYMLDRADLPVLMRH
jgi:nucleotide-binding universal stress UspA family protein